MHTGNRHFWDLAQTASRQVLEGEVIAEQEEELTFVGKLMPATELHPGELLFNTTFMAKSTALKPTAHVL